MHIGNNVGSVIPPNNKRANFFVWETKPDVRADPELCRGSHLDFKGENLKP